MRVIEQEHNKERGASTAGYLSHRRRERTSIFGESGLTMTTSAFLPVSSEPISSSHSNARAPLMVAISSTRSDGTTEVIILTRKRSNTREKRGRRRQKTARKKSKRNRRKKDGNCHTGEEKADLNERTTMETREL